MSKDMKVLALFTFISWLAEYVHNLVDLPQLSIFSPENSIPAIISLLLFVLLLESALQSLQLWVFAGMGIYSTYWWDSFSVATAFFALCPCTNAIALFHARDLCHSTSASHRDFVAGLTKSVIQFYTPPNLVGILNLSIVERGLGVAVACDELHIGNTAPCG